MKKDFYQHYFEVEKSHWLMKGRRAFARSLLADVHVTKESNVLDIGCGSGFLIGELQKEGWINTHGVDSEEKAIVFGKEKGVENLTLSRNESLPFQNATMDAVLSMDVIEHTPDDLPSLREMHRVLKPGGYAIIFVPAYMFLWGVQDEVAHHYRRYTMGTLLKQIRHIEGFSIVRRTYFNTFLFPLIALVRLGSWMFNVRARESDFDLNNAIVNTIFSGIFSIERFFLKYSNFPFGVSIAIVLKKDL